MDLISRQAAIDFIDAGHLVNPNEPRWSDNEVVNFLKSRPSAQPDLSEYSDKLWRNAYERGKRDAQPEIIRCRDCIAYQEGIDIDGKPFTRCNGINGSVRTYGHTLPDWYCADAERRTDDLQ